MIISKTPLRISFFGGGTDYPKWFKENPGAVLATSINKYIYVTARFLPPFFNFKSRISWSQIEYVNGIDEIKNPAVRECLRFMKINEGVEVHYVADLPAQTGLGSSSSFTVGILNGMYSMKEKMVSKMQLARDAIHVEQDMIGENVGSQDQISAAFGGFNLVEFKKDGDFSISPIIIEKKRLDLFKSHLMLFFTGFSRTASEIAVEQIKNIKEKNTELNTMYKMVFEGIKILTGEADISEFGKLLNEAWQIKRGLSNKITTSEIDDIYASALKAGAIGGKLLGAGGGGFMLIFAKPESQPGIKNRLNKLLCVPFDFESTGSQVIFYNP